MKTDENQDFIPLEQASRPTVPTDGLVHPSILSTSSVISTTEEGLPARESASVSALSGQEPPFTVLLLFLIKGGQIAQIGLVLFGLKMLII